MKIYSLIILSLGLIFSFTSCKKGCTDPYATNYKPKKTIDKGNCNVYSHVTLNSILIKKIPALNSDNEYWDNATNNDTDHDGSHPDLYVSFRAEGGYVYEPSTYLPTVDPQNVDWLQKLDIPISVYDWKNDKGFYAFFYEVDGGGTSYILMDSVKIDPFDYEAKNNRFKDTMVVISGQFNFTANMAWE